MHTLTLEKSHGRDLALVVLTSFVLCLSGSIAIPLWFTPVPLMIRNSLILTSSFLLGARRGSAATFLFLLQGAVGLPVFPNGAAGVHHFWGPTGGYLIGYLIASYVVGYMSEKGKGPLVSFVLGNGIIYLCGAGYLASFMGIEKAFLLGIAPFLLGDLLKTWFSCKCLHWMGRRQ